MSDNVIGCFPVAFRLCCSPGPLQFPLGFLGRLREGEMDRTESQPRSKMTMVFLPIPAFLLRFIAGCPEPFFLPPVHPIWPPSPI